MNLTDFRPSPLADRLPFELKVLYLEVCGLATIPPTVRTLRDVWWSILMDGLPERFLERFRVLEIEAYRRERSRPALYRWFAQESEHLWNALEEDAKSSGDRIGATRRCLSALQAINLPEHFRGQRKSPRPSALPNPDVLLQEHQKIVGRCRQFVLRATNRFTAMLDAFPDVEHEVLAGAHDRPGRFSPERVAKSILAAKYETTMTKIERHLRKPLTRSPRQS